MLPTFAELYQRADARREPVNIAVAGGDDPTVIEALGLAVQRGWVRPVLVGPESRIREIAATLNVTLDEMRVWTTPGQTTWLESRSPRFVPGGLAS